jgi:hypothetical protein
MRALRRSGARLALVGIAAYAVFLAVRLPAACVGLALERASGGVVAIGDPRGSAWKGGGVLMLRAGGSWRRIEDIEWDCKALALLFARMECAVSGSGRVIDLHILASFGATGTSFRKIELVAPAAVLEPFIAVAALARLRGRLRLTSESIEVGETMLRGAAILEWTGAALDGFRAERLGDYRLQVNAGGDRAAITLTTLRGDLRVDAQGEWRAAQPRQLELRGVAEAVAARKDLDLLMQALGARGAGVPQPFRWMLPLG